MITIVTAIKIAIAISRIHQGNDEYHVRVLDTSGSCSVGGVGVDSPSVTGSGM